MAAGESDDFARIRIRRWWPWKCRGTGAWEGAPTPRRIHQPTMWGLVWAVIFSEAAQGGCLTLACRPLPLLCAHALVTGQGASASVWVTGALLASGCHVRGPLCQGASAACAIALYPRARPT